MTAYDIVQHENILEQRAGGDDFGMKCKSNKIASFFTWLNPGYPGRVWMWYIMFYGTSGDHGFDLILERFMIFTGHKTLQNQITLLIQKSHG